MENVEIVGTGSYLPGDPITNEELASVFGREMIWLAEMIGARVRHFAVDLNTLQLRPGETNASMSSKAARQALDDAGIDPQSIDLIVMSTSTPDYPFPATALFVQEELGIPPCCVMELRAGCGGMAQAFVIAKHMLAAGSARTALLIGSDLLSPFISMFDRGEQSNNKDLLVSLAMFGDGAGAMVLTAGGAKSGVLDVMSQSMSTGRPAAMILRGGGALAPAGSRHDDSAKVFQHDYQAIMTYGPDLIRSTSRWLCDERGYRFDQFAYIVPPQVNQRMIDLTVNQLELPASKVVSDFARVGNTVSASIYLALDHMNRTNQLKSDDLIVLLPAEATKWVYGGVVIRWTKESS